MTGQNSITRIVVLWRPIEYVNDASVGSILGWAAGWPHPETLDWFPENNAWGQESDSGRLTEFNPSHFALIPEAPK